MIDANVIGEIRMLVEELKVSASDNNLSRKIEVGTLLSTYNWYLAEQVADVYRRVNEAEYDYKTAMVREINKGTGGYQNKEALAKELLADKYRELIAAETLLKRLTLLYQQTNVVVEQNRQNCAYLRKENAG